MKSVIITDVRIFKIDGEYYSKDAFFRVLERYCNNFSNVKVITRVIEKELIEKDYKKIDFKNAVDFINVGSILSSFLSINDNNIKDVIKECDIVILRLPSIVSINLFKYVKKYKKIYFTELMGCAWDAYWNHSFFGKIVAPFMFFKMKKIVKNANYALYVTANFLQKRYPTRCDSIAASNVRINFFSDDVIALRKKKIQNKNNDTLYLMTTAAVDVKYKGQEYVIRSIPILKKRGINVKYYLAGGGDQSRLKKIISKYKVDENVCFLGSLPHDEVFSYLDKIDIYIQPSLQEGLPRAVIEALSRGCPVIGTTTAGIPELVQDRFLVKRKSSKDISKKILDYISLDEKDKLKIIDENYKKSKQYDEQILNERRNKYFIKILKNKK